MERGGSAKCYKCGCEANRFYTFARLSDKEAFLGVVKRNVCDECLSRYIEEVKSGRKGRYEFLIWLPILLPFGLLLAALADNASWRIVGWILLIFGLLLPVMTYTAHRREMKRAREASFESNAERYGREMCVEDAMKTNRQAKLVVIKRDYAQDDYTVDRIAGDAGVTAQTAAAIKSVVGKISDAAADG